MFTVEQIQNAHGKVKSGADFPAYIHDIKKLGVTFYETFVVDGHTDYYDSDHFKVTSPAKYESLAIAGRCEKEAFKACLKEHQQGKTGYQAFIALSAESGVEKWSVCTQTMTCTYFDKQGHEILVEEIPS